LDLKGIILAGGLGSRLFPLTKITNKHLLPVFYRPMIYYPLEQLVGAGIHEIMLVTGGSFAGHFLNLLENGGQFGLTRLHYAFQQGEGGIADALKLAEEFVEDSRCVVILGDNIFEKPIASAVERFIAQKSGARIFLKQVPDPERFGVAELQGDNVVSIEEKPGTPKSNYAVTGVYMYDSQVWEILKTLKPSARNELEITDVNNEYVRRKELAYDIVDGWWTDAGTFESLQRASQLVAEMRKTRQD
jgi:glucose-1-phosphate thymidylyltransferase